ncbi:MAG TPA: hypothetical protein VFQ23_15355 [Anaerolineales bacterium]|nr:hypothetical protein [Anaerolineales bacterium]
MKNIVFVIKDERHAEIQEGVFEQLSDVLDELERRATIAWDERPNRAPCPNWEKCGRNYEIVKYDQSSVPWMELRKTAALEISANGINWLLPPT